MFGTTKAERFLSFGGTSCVLFLATARPCCTVYTDSPWHVRPRDAGLSSLWHPLFILPASVARPAPLRGACLLVWH